MTNTGSYFENRAHLMYYIYVDRLVRGLAADARSLIDIGSANTSCIESFDWIPVRHALDLRRPYRSSNVRGIRANFLRFVPEARYDFVTCLQVLEHVPDPPAFAAKLMETADRILVSVPYEWPAGSNKHHLHDPINRRLVRRWFGKKPDYTVVVHEPLSAKLRGRRMFAYFHNDGPMPGLVDIRDRMKASLAEKSPAGVDEPSGVRSSGEARPPIRAGRLAKSPFPPAEPPSPAA